LVAEQDHGGVDAAGASFADHDNIQKPHVAGNSLWLTDEPSCFPHVDRLVRDFLWEVVVGYVFSRIEYAKRMTPYCGLRKVWRIEAHTAWKFVSNDYLSRQRFKTLV
jgi:hypothetical protein